MIFTKYSLDLYQAYKAIKPYFNELGLVIRDALSVFLWYACTLVYVNNRKHVILKLFFQNLSAVWSFLQRIAPVTPSD